MTDGMTRERPRGLRSTYDYYGGHFSQKGLSRVSTSRQFSFNNAERFSCLYYVSCSTMYADVTQRFRPGTNLPGKYMLTETLW